MRVAERSCSTQLLDPAVERYSALQDDDQREAFRAALTAFVRLYAFLAQVVPFTDTDLEQLYIYGRFLALRLPREQDAAPGPLRRRRAHPPAHRADRRRTTSRSPTAAASIRGFTGEGTGGSDPQIAQLSEIIDSSTSVSARSSPRPTRCSCDQIEQSLR